MRRDTFVQVFVLTACCLFAAAPNSAAATLLPANIWVTEPITLMHAGNFFPTAYVAPSNTRVLLSGYWITGEFYSVYVNGSLVLTTPQVTPVGVDYGDAPTPLYRDPASAYASHLFSTGSFLVQKGDLITIQDLNPPGGIGEVGLQATPEPGSFALFGLSLAGLYLRRRRLFGQ